MMLLGLGAVGGLLGDVKSTKEKLNKPVCFRCGHKWHWTEVFYLSVGILGCILMSVRFASVTFPQWIIALILVVVSGSACGYVWNLCTQRKLSQGTERMKKEIDKMKAENDKLRATTSQITASNERFEKEIGMIEEARVTLGRSVVSLEKVNAKQQEIVKKTEDIVEQRRVFGRKLEDLTHRANEHATIMAQQNFEEKSLALFDMICKSPDRILRCGASLSELKAALEEDGIDWTAEINDAFASNDMNKQEFGKMMKILVSQHMAELNDAVLEARAYRQRNIILDKEISRVSRVCRRVRGG